MTRMRSHRLGSKDKILEIFQGPKFRVLYIYMYVFITGTGIDDIYAMSFGLSPTINDDINDMCFNSSSAIDDDINDISLYSVLHYDTWIGCSIVNFVYIHPCIQIAYHQYAPMYINLMGFT